MFDLFTQDAPEVLDFAEQRRRDGRIYHHSERRGELGQFATPAVVARFMARLLEFDAHSPVRLLDAGAGNGMLSLAALEQMSLGEEADRTITVTAYESDAEVARLATQNFEKAATGSICGHIDACVLEEDYLLSQKPALLYSHVILNPPYKKFPSGDSRQVALRAAGIKTVNLYAAFVWKAITELAEGGQLVAIIPRSFCNGTYYRPFRQFLLRETQLVHIHTFDSRDSLFATDSVLQENVILVLRKVDSRFNGVENNTRVTRSASNDLSYTFDQTITQKELVWQPNTNAFLRIERDDRELPTGTLADLGIEVSTGPIVDFRVVDALSTTSATGAYPLIRPRHCVSGACTWPNPEGSRLDAVQLTPATDKGLWPAGHYVVVRRISSKEEPHRVVASVITPAIATNRRVAFENHLNVFHRNRSGLPAELAYQLCAYLNSDEVDRFIRTISGHTQVNATDLRALPYPELAEFVATPTLNV